MYEVLDKDTIKSEILPFLSVAKRGYVTKSDLVEVIQCIPFVQIAIFTVYARRIRLHQRLDQLLHISMASGISLCSVTYMALVVFLFNLYRMHRIIISRRLLFKAYPRFATDKCGRISDFIVSLSIALHMERVFVLVRFCITDIISSSQFIGTLKVKKALNRNKQNGKIRTTFCGLL